MKWITHQVVAMAGAWELNFPIVAMGGVMLGSILPDIIDSGMAKFSSNPQKNFYKVHRGFTHWYGFYAILLALAYVLIWHPKILYINYMDKTSIYIVAGIAFGGLMHVILDMCTPSGVPLLPFRKNPRFSLRLFKTGSWQEYVFLACFMLIFAYINGYNFKPFYHLWKRIF